LKASLVWDRSRAEARRELERAVERDPDYCPALYHLALLSMDRGEILRAVRLLDRILKHYPDDWEARYRLGIGLVLFGQKLEQRVSSSIYSVPTGSHPDEREVLGLWLVASFLRAEKELTALKSSSVPYRELDRQHYYLAAAQQALGKRAEAIESLHAQLRWMPSDRAARGRLEKLLEEAGRISEVKEVRTPPNDPEEARVMWDRAVQTFGKGQFGKGVEILLLALEKAPLDLELHQKTGRMLYGMGSREEACEAWRRGLKYFPGDQEMGTHFAFTAELLGERAVLPADRTRWYREAAQVIQALAERESDPTYRHEFRNRVKELEALAAGQ
jgi:tetratricopeptide (TPR) repeat protein